MKDDQYWGVLDEIASERQRQIEKEGWSQVHDDKHRDGELALAATFYAMPKRLRKVWGRSSAARGFGPLVKNVPYGWPWSPEWWKPKSTRRDLVRAAALIVAEIERLDRSKP